MHSFIFFLKPLVFSFEMLQLVPDQFEPLPEDSSTPVLSDELVDVVQEFHAGQSGSGFDGQLIG